MSEYDKEYYAKNKKLKRSKWDAWARTLRGQFTTSKNKAEYNDQDWTLTFEEYSSLRSKNCYYCNGSLPETGRGLDRVDNSKGYTVANVVACCGGCNRLKGDILSLEETAEMVKLLKILRGKDDIWNTFYLL